MANHMVSFFLFPTSKLPHPSVHANHIHVPCSWVYPTEIFPLATRAKGTALATVAFSVAGGIINEIVPYLIDAVSFWVFILFALLNLVMLIPIYLFYIGKFFPLRLFLISHAGKMSCQCASC